MPVRVSYTVEGTQTKGATTFGSKPAAILWLMESAERQGLAEISFDEKWDPDCVGYKTDDVHRNLPFPQCCIHFDSKECDCGV